MFCDVCKAEKMLNYAYDPSGPVFEVRKTTSGASIELPEQACSLECVTAAMAEWAARQGA